LSFIVPAYAANHLMPWPLIAEFGRDLLSFMQVDNVRDGNKIYISRRDSSYRRIVNEGELEERLQELGFAIIQLSRMSFPEQVRCLASASLVVAPHGAGLANLIFCRAGTKVVEIMPEAYILPCFASLSQVCGLDYQVYVCPTDEFVGRQQKLQWKVPIDALLHKLEDV
jgi:capsular polysaccharide biosynthesis protein